MSVAWLLTATRLLALKISIRRTCACAPRHAAPPLYRDGDARTANVPAAAAARAARVPFTSTRQRVRGVQRARA